MPLAFIIILIGCAHTPKVSLPKKAHVLIIPGTLDTTFFDSEDATTWISLTDLIFSIPHRTRKNFAFPNYFDNSARKHLVGRYKKNGTPDPIFSNHVPQIPFSHLPVKSHTDGILCPANYIEGGLCGITYRANIPQTKHLSRKNRRLAQLFKDTSIENYATMAIRLEDAGYVPGINLWGFPYDWRNSVRDEIMLDRLDHVLSKISKNGTEKIIIVAHSLGNFVAKSYLAHYPGNFKKYISNWVSIAPPLQGVGGKLTTSIINGYHTSFSLYCDNTATALTSNSPSFFEMLPTKWLEKREPLEINVENIHGDLTPIKGIKQFEKLLIAGKKNATITLDGKTENIPVGPEIFAWANETKEILDKARLPDEVKYHLIYNDTLPTEYNINFKVDVKNWEPKDITCAERPSPQNYCRTQKLCAPPKFTNLSGDGTVPAISALHPFGNVKNNPKHMSQIKVPGVLHQNLIQDEKIVIPYILKLLSSKEN